jgi:hypothetical protein
MEAFNVWSDGFSPIVFSTLDGNVKIDHTQVSRKILAVGKEMTKKFKQIFIVLNCSLLEFSHENIELIKAIKSDIGQKFIKSIAVVMPCKKKFDINFCAEENEIEIKSFDCFEEALGYINHQMEEQTEVI